MYQRAILRLCQGAADKEEVVMPQMLGHKLWKMQMIRLGGISITFRPYMGGVIVKM